MVVYGINNQKKFNDLWSLYKEGCISIIQGDDNVNFLNNNNTVMWVIDFINYYHFFDKNIHGEDPIIWG